MSNKEIKPCEQCGGNRWSTLKKGKKYKCRALVPTLMGVGGVKVGCGYVREVK